MAVAAVPVDNRLYEYERRQAFAALREGGYLIKELYPIIEAYMDFKPNPPKMPTRDLLMIFVKNVGSTAAPAMAGGGAFAIGKCLEYVWTADRLGKEQIECARIDAIFKQLSINWRECFQECVDNVTHFVRSMEGPWILQDGPWQLDTEQLYRRTTLENCVSYCPDNPTSDHGSLCQRIDRDIVENEDLLLDPMPQTMGPMLAGAVAAIVYAALLFTDVRELPLHGWICGGAFGYITWLASGSWPIAIFAIIAVGAVVGGGVAVRKHIYDQY